MTTTQSQLRRLASGTSTIWHHVLPRLTRLREAGMTTAEYAVGTVAAVAFAAVLLAVVRSSAVKTALTKIITSAIGG
ncbi:MAG: DUF4244 domain-containing protein [Nostocoides sp.]